MLLGVAGNALFQLFGARRIILSGAGRVGEGNVRDTQRQRMVLICTLKTFTGKDLLPGLLPLRLERAGREHELQRITAIRER